MDEPSSWDALSLAIYFNKKITTFITPLKHWCNESSNFNGLTNQVFPVHIRDFNVYFELLAKLN